MYKIHIRRTIELNAPFNIVKDTNNDWTHFAHLHRKTHSSYRLLYKNGRRAIFLYKARRLYPFPFYDDYIVFREDRSSRDGFRNVYVNTKSGWVHALDTWVEPLGERTVQMNDFFFSLPSYWRLLPKLFLWIFMEVFKRRMDRVVDEDNKWIYEQMTAEGSPANDACAPVISETYDVLDDFFKKGAWESADVHLQDRVSETFDGKGRLRLKRR